MRVAFGDHLRLLLDGAVAFLGEPAGGFQVLRQVGDGLVSLADHLREVANLDRGQLRLGLERVQRDLVLDVPGQQRVVELAPARKDHPQPPRMPELERRVLLADLAPEAGRTVAAVLGHVVQQHDAVGPQSGQPGVKVFADRLVVMASVDVQDVDRVVFDLLACLSEEHLEQSDAYVRVKPPQGLLDVLEDLGAVGAGVLVAPPGIDGDALGLQLVVAHGLHEREEGRAPVRAQLDDPPGAQERDQIIGEVAVPAPRVDRVQRQQRIDVELRIADVPASLHGPLAPDSARRIMARPPRRRGADRPAGAGSRRD